MGVFSNIKDAKGSRGGLYIQPGNYVVQILRCQMRKNYAKKNCFIAELLVIKSDNEDLKAGSEPSFVINLDSDYPDLALGDVADFMRAGLASLADMHEEPRPDDLDEVEVDEEVADTIAGEDNLLAGTYLTAKAHNRITREGNDFTRIKWGVPEDLKDLAARADAA